MPQITVTDEQGNFYFPTFPRRARGLVKKGRARFISANTICLNCPPQNQEEQQMTENTNTSSRTAPTAAEIFAELQQIRQDTQHLSLALEKLEKVPADNNADEKICQAKIDAIEEVVVQREETNRSLITLYEKLYDAIR